MGVRRCKCQRSEEHFTAQLLNLGIGKEHATANLKSNFSKALQQFAEDYLREASSLLIRGLPGTGKTYLLAALCREYLRQGREVRFSLCRELLRKLWDTFREKAETTEDRLIAELTSIQVLAVDDLGKEGKISDASLGALHEILSKRNDNQRTTIVTTNLTFAEIGQLYDPSIASRMSGWQSVVMTGKDRRKRGALPV